MPFLLPASFGQESLYLVEQATGNGLLYVVPYHLIIDGPLCHSALAQAFQDLANRHESLRASFVEREGALHQLVDETCKLDLAIEDLSTLSEIDQRARIEEASRYNALTPFDMGRGPLARWRLLTCADSRHHLLLAFHHAIFDGWSGNIVARDLGEYYCARLAGVSPKLPELTLQPGDHAAWQRECFARGDFDGDLRHWRQLLSGAPAITNLTIARARPASPTHAGGIRTRMLSASLSASLLRIAQQQSVTPFILFAAAVNALILPYTGERDICLGFPVAGREHPDLEEVAGFLANMLVLRTQLAEATSFLDILKETSRGTLRALQHAEVPFERIVQELCPQRSAQWHPLFQICVTYQSSSTDSAWSFGEARAIASHPHVPVAKFDLLFCFVETEGQIELEIEHSKELFGDPEISRLETSLVKILERIASSPNLSIADCIRPSGKEAQAAIEEGRGRSSPLPAATIARIFEEQVRRSPDQLALSGDGISVSYSALNSKANNLAQALQARGVAMETPVGVIGRSGVNMVVSVLAILKAGGCYVPLDERYPEERLALMLKASGARLVVLAGEKPEWLHAPDPEIEVLDAVQLNSGENRAANPPRVENSDTLAYIMFTSGSTGVPKAVGVSHKAVCRLVIGNPFLPFEDGLVFPQIANISFDASTLEFWGTLLHGGTLVLSPEEGILDPHRFATHLERHKVDSLFITTALLSRFASTRPEMFSTVRHLVFGGERADVAALQLLRKHGYRGRVINAYGPTETTTFACTHEVREDDLRGDVPIGRPIANTSAHVLDESLDPVGVGAVGDLYIGGPGLARGYLGRPGLTAERFLPNPHSSEPGERLYRTGDRCSRNADETIRFLGRTDEQVKLDGFRIELGEIRAAILDVCEAREAVVRVESAPAGDRSIAAYVRLASPLSGEEIKARLSQRLPSFMVPARMTIVTEMPLTANGKLDDARLRSLVLAQGTPSEPQMCAPRSSVASALLEIVRDILGCPNASESDNFFRIGGTSLGALRLIARCREALGRHLPLGKIFQADTIGALVLCLENAPRRVLTLSDPQANPNATPRRTRLSFAQERLYFLEKLLPGSALYSVPFRLDLEGELDIDGLHQAVYSLVERQEMLRARFLEEDGVVYQHAGPSWRFSLPIEDLSTVREDEQQQILERIELKIAKAPYNLCAPGLLRVRLCRMKTDRHAVFLGIHHIAFDSRSTTILAQELSELYRAARDRRPASLPLLKLQYGDFAEWQRRRHQEGAMADDLAYWRETLKDAPALCELPLDAPRSTSRKFTGETLAVTLAPGIDQALFALAEALRVTPFILLAAAMNIQLSEHSGKGDICIGFPVSDRGHPALEGVIGLLTNTCVLRTKFDRAETASAIVEKTRRAMLGAMEHAEVPFDLVVAAIDPARTSVAHPLFQVCLTYHDDAVPEAWTLGDARMVVSCLDIGMAKFDLALAATRTPGGLCLNLDYSNEIFRENTIRDMADRLARILQRFAEEQCALPILPEIATSKAASTARSFRRR